MSAALSLMEALLGTDTSAADAQQALEQALEVDVDPLHWCAAHLNLSDAQIMRRAAEWAGMVYFDTVPRISQVAIEPDRLEALGNVRLYRVRLHNEDVAFAAPDFFGLLRLVQARDGHPGLRRRLVLVPLPALRRFLVSQASTALLDGARQTLARNWPHAAAQLELTRPVRYGFVASLVVVTMLIILAPLSGQVWLAPFWIALVLLPTMLRLCALAVPAEPPFPAEIGAEARAALPVYSVLVPLRDEVNMVDQLCAALGRIDYPAEKLDIIFVVEQRSTATVTAIRRHLGDARFSIIEVPDAPPRTKPKALNFALPFCRGEFVVVFDAEDRPQPDQLLRVLGQFRRQPDIACIQARLVIDNGHNGAIPALFAGEYAGLFAVLLPALARWGAVAPLGGTSNHFRTATLRQLGGWDAFNVTEDADLGVRLSRRQLGCATSTAATYEAAPVRAKPWMGQRTRWMKGWMQTYAVHNRRPGDLVRDLGWRGAALFHVIVLGMLLAPLLHAAFLVVLLIMAGLGHLAWPRLEFWPVACFTVLVLGQGTAIATNMVGLARTGQRGLYWWQALLPIYWGMIGVATILALREFALRPFHWFKTPHVANSSPPSEPAVDVNDTSPVAGPTTRSVGRRGGWGGSAAE
jgi:cellulose synthase/poly-beta-1,6-N-acetylglucosamine synthase-like glycosyltransferase